MFLEWQNKDNIRQIFDQKIIEINNLYSLRKHEENELYNKWINNKQTSDAWSKNWCSFAKKNSATLAARYVLKKRKAKNDKMTLNSNAETELTNDIKKSLAVAQKYFKSHDIFTAEQVGELNKAALKYFKQHNTGPAAKMMIDAFKRPLSAYDYTESAKNWANPLYFPRMLGLSLWDDHTRIYLGENEKKPAALAEPIYMQMTNLMTKENSLNSKGNAILNASGQQIANIELEIAKSVLASGIPLLSSITAHYVVTWILKQVHKQFLMKQKNPRRIVLKGNAYERLGELCGVGTHPNTIDKLRKIIPMLSGCLFKYRINNRSREGNFLSYCYERAINGKYSILIIEMQPMACPGFVKTLPEGGVLFQEQRKAVPIMSPFPSYGKLKKNYGPQVRFQDEIIMEMRSRAKEIYTRGGIAISDETLRDFAQMAFLPEKMIEPVLDFWVDEDCLTRSDEGLYNIGSRESAACRMIEEDGRYEHEGALAAKRRLEKQRKKIARG